MAERFTPHPEEIRKTMVSLGYGSEHGLAQIYSLHHVNRQVFRITDGAGQSVVVKVRPADTEARRELQMITTLVGSYRFSGGHFPTIRQTEFDGKVAITMPYLGQSLPELAQAMDPAFAEHATEDTASPFPGFSAAQIEQLLGRLENTHLNFAHSQGYVHGDVILPHHKPTNIVYHATSNLLYLVDGEALAATTDETVTRFTDQICNAREWMYANLERV
jgi:serine/threonine protein kinase